MSPRSIGLQIQDLIGLIYDSAQDGTRWPAFLEAFARAVDTPRCALLIHDTEGDGAAAVRWHGWPDQDIQLYFDRYAALDPWRSSTFLLSEGDVATDYEFYPREKMETSATFREFYAPRDCIHTLGAIILTTTTGQSVITCHRGVAAGPFGEQEKSVLQALITHLKRAALLQGELGSLRRRLATFTGHLERYPYAFLLADGEGRVLYSNAAAREIVAARDGLAIENGRLVTLSQHRDAAFGKALAQTAAGQGPSLRRLEIPRPSRRKSYRAILMPIDDLRSIPLGVAIPAVSILLIDADSFSTPDPEVLRELFSFTPAEARVSAKLLLGQNAEEIAGESKVSVETVRTHIKRIFSKTATSRQSELVSLILRSIPFR
jgi:DNA-binding CsgD family transcriptional regulator/PAS domain-containing protein